VLGATAAVIAAGVVLGGVLAVGSVAQAQTPGDKESLRSRYEELLAQRLGISVAQLQAAQKGARDQMIDEAVSRGVITSEQAEKLKSAPPGSLPGRIRAGARGVVFGILEAAAKVIGISQDEVKTGLQNGQSLTQIASGKGVGRDALKSGMQAELRAKVQEALAKGTINQAQADRLLQGLDQHLDGIIDRTGGGGHGPFGGRFRPGR
jgi:ribosomal protein S20